MIELRAALAALVLLATLPVQAATLLIGVSMVS